MPNNSKSLISACGIFECATCTHLTHSRCSGCAEGNALLLADGDQQCEVYQCTITHGISSCNECTEPMCSFTRTSTMVCPVRARYEKKRCYTRKIAESLSSRQPVRQEVAVVSKKLDKAVARLPWYLFAVEEYLSNGLTTISSADIARKVGVDSWVVRRDLSQFGGFGRPSLGYEAEWLRSCLTDVLHLNTMRNVAWVGADRIEADKSLITRFSDHNFNIVAIFAIDISRSPEMVCGIRVASIDEMQQIVKDLGVECGIIATDHEYAQTVADILVAAGVKGILNLTPMPIALPSDVCVRNIDIAAELFALSFYCAQAHGKNTPDTEVD